MKIPTTRIIETGTQRIPSNPIELQRTQPNPTKLPKAACTRSGACWCEQTQNAYFRFSKSSEVVDTHLCFSLYVDNNKWNRWDAHSRKMGYRKKYKHLPQSPAKVGPPQPRGVAPPKLTLRFPAWCLGTGAVSLFFARSVLLNASYGAGCTDVNTLIIQKSNFETRKMIQECELPKAYFFLYTILIPVSVLVLLVLIFVRAPNS